jgi:hypothetical protein
VLPLSVVKPQLVTLPRYRASYLRLHDFAARACFTLTRNIRLNVFQERGMSITSMRRARCHAPHTKRLGLPNHDGQVFYRTSRAERLLCMHLRALRFPLKNFGASARPTLAVCFLAFVFSLTFSFLRSREFQVGVCIDIPWTLAASAWRSMDTIRTKCTPDSSCLDVPV